MSHYFRNVQFCIIGVMKGSMKGASPSTEDLLQSKKCNTLLENLKIILGMLQQYYNIKRYFR